MITTLVLAGSYQQYEFYLRETGNSSKTHKYIMSMSDTFGFRDIPIVYYGKWYKSTNIDMNYIKAIEQKKKEKVVV